jgi:hypothetical protein
LRESITLCWSVELNQGNALVGVDVEFEVLEVVHCDVICGDENALQDEAVETWNLEPWLYGKKETKCYAKVDDILHFKSSASHAKAFNRRHVDTLIDPLVHRIEKQLSLFQPCGVACHRSRSGGFGN